MGAACRQMRRPPTPPWTTAECSVYVQPGYARARYVEILLLEELSQVNDEK